MDNDDSGGVAGPDDEPPRCQMVHREVDEGMRHRDAMNVHRERPESVFRHPDPPFSRLSHDFGRWWRSATFRDPEVGGTFDCRAGHVVPHAIDDSRGSDDKISKPESASR